VHRAAPLFQYFNAKGISFFTKGIFVLCKFDLIEQAQAPPDPENG
jgi:hypothetical protein